MTSLLIENTTVITMDRDRRILEEATIAVEDGRIVSVGAGPGDGRRYDEVIDASRMLALPGLIDCHAHAGHGLVKSTGADLGDGWNEACERVYAGASDEAFWEAEAALAGLERLKFGITCGMSLLGGGNSIYRSDEPQYAEAHCRAIERLGLRSYLAVGPCPPPYPRRFTRWGAEGRSSHMVDLDTQLETCERIIETSHGRTDERIQIALVSPTVHPSARTAAPEQAGALDRQAVETRALSRRHGVLFTQDGHHHGSVEAAHALGLLGPDALLSHSTDLTAEEIALAARTDTRIVHNPSAIAAINGRCPVPELIEAGVTVVIGSDGTGPDRSHDLFRHMQQCMHYHRRHFRDAGVLPPGKTLEMVTIDAARALGREADLGSIEPGKRADLVLLDLYKPHLYPLSMPLYRAVYFANGNDIDTVVVDGNVLMHGRRVRCVEESAVLDAAQAAWLVALERAELEPLTRLPERVWGHARF